MKVEEKLPKNDDDQEKAKKMGGREGLVENGQQTPYVHKSLGEKILNNKTKVPSVN